MSAPVLAAHADKFLYLNEHVFPARTNFNDIVTFRLPHHPHTLLICGVIPHGNEL